MKFIVTGTEVVRGRGKVHWVLSGATTYVTGCGRKTDNMVSSYHSNVTHLTCEECQEAFVVDTLRREEDERPGVLGAALGEQLDRIAFDRVGMERLPGETDGHLRDRVRAAFAKYAVGLAAGSDDGKTGG